jgi:hypothetical protein
MDHVAQIKSNEGMLKNAATVDEGVVDSRPEGSSAAPHVRVGEEEEVRANTTRRRPWARKRKSYSHAHFKVYKRRWFGLAQLVLLNVVVSWDVSIYPISHYYTKRRIHKRHEAGLALRLHMMKRTSITDQDISGSPSHLSQLLRHSTLMYPNLQ